MDEPRTLREWRELRGLSREELAEETFLEENLIARIEEVGELVTDSSAPPEGPPDVDRLVATAAKYGAEISPPQSPTRF